MGKYLIHYKERSIKDLTPFLFAVVYHDAEEAAQVLCFANLLLDMVEECE